MNQRQSFIMIGKAELQPGCRFQWECESWMALQSGRRCKPSQKAFAAHRLMITVRGSKDEDFSIVMRGWRAGDLQVDGLSHVFCRGAEIMWLHPYHATCHIKSGWSLELDVENTGSRVVTAVGALLGVVDASVPSLQGGET